MEEAPLDAESDRAREPCLRSLSGEAWALNLLWKRRKTEVIHDLYQHHSQPESEDHWSLPGHRHMLWALFPHAGYYILSTCFYLNVKIIKQHVDKLI